MARRNSEILVSFTPSARGDTVWAIIETDVVLEHVKVSDYYFVFDKVRNRLSISPRRPQEPKP